MTVWRASLRVWWRFSRLSAGAFGAEMTGGEDGDSCG